MARPVRRVGLAQVPARLARPEPAADGRSTTSTSSTRTASTPTRRSRRRWARWTARCARARRCTPASPRTRRSARARRRAILRDLGTPLLIHQPSYSLLNRWIEPDCSTCSARRASARSCSRRSAQGMLTDKYLGGIPEDSRAAQDGSLSARLPHRGEPRARPRAQRDRRPPRPDARADGDRVDAARPARHLGADRRVAASRSSSRTSRRSTSSSSPTTELAEIDRYAVGLQINLWEPSSRG